MRIYKTDGTFVENRRDTGFGWNFNDIGEVQKLQQEKQKGTENKSSHLKQLRKEDTFLESVDIVEPEQPVIVKHVKVNVKTAPIMNVINCKMDVEGPPVKKNDPVKELKNISVTTPTKEELAKLINPCNIETKALMSVIYFAKYKSLIKEETSAELFKAVNFKTTNSKFLIRDKQCSIQEDMIKDIQHYQATKEDHMLSLMMELILADMGCNLEDLVDVADQATADCYPEAQSETNDSLESTQSSFSSKELTPFKRSYLNIPDRCSILSSIGLSDEDKSVQSFCEETLEMRLQTAEIRESFQKEENRVNNLIKLTTALKEEMRETLYLDDILHLLKGDVEKVKLKKLPFKIFYKDQNSDVDLNLII